MAALLLQLMPPPAARQWAQRKSHRRQTARTKTTIAHSVVPTNLQH